MSEQNRTARSRTAGSMSRAEVLAEVELVRMHLSPRLRQIICDYVDKKITYEEAQESVIRARDEFLEQFPSRRIGGGAGGPHPPSPCPEQQTLRTSSLRQWKQ